ncbi:hypothetical protein AAVH_14875 [Aphelenchoides avenae]|nr:hypothetical protein AAVH_14875 [Aphelenchus avenae]
MASGKKGDDTPTGDFQLWCNIDDGESDQNPYIQKTRSRSTSSKRKPWSGTPQFGPLPTAGSTVTEAASSSQEIAPENPADSRFGPLPIVEGTGSQAETTPKDPATETTESYPGPLPDEDTDADAATCASISASSSTEQLNQPKGLLATTKAAKRVARKLFRQQHMVKPPKLTAAEIAAVRKIQAELKQVKKEPVSRPTSPQQNVDKPPELSDLEIATAEKIRAQLKKEREAAAAKPKAVQRPTSPYLFMELSAAQHVRTVAELKTAVKQLYQRWQHTQPPGPSPIVFSPMWKEKHP